MDAIDAFRKDALEPDHHRQRGSAQTGYLLPGKEEALANHYDTLPKIV